MRDSHDNSTPDLPGLVEKQPWIPPKKRGPKPGGKAMTAAERKRKQRAKEKANPKPITPEEWVELGVANNFVTVTAKPVLIREAHFQLKQKAVTVTKKTLTLPQRTIKKP